MLRFLLHYGIHILVPIGIALVFYPNQRVRAALILLAGFLLDIDHLWADPVFDPDRCSIGFHILHSYIAIAMYTVLLFSKKLRIIGLACLVHMAADAVDCLFILNAA